MGLDIYLSYYKDYGRTRLAEEEYLTRLLELNTEDPTAHIAKRRELARELGLQHRGPANIGRPLKRDAKDITIPSAQHPGHMYKIGYLQSSNNPAGLNNVLTDMGLAGLYYIFGKESDDYVFAPDWKESLRRAAETLVAYKANRASVPYDAEQFLVAAEGWAPMEAIISPEAAMMYCQETENITLPGDTRAVALLAPLREPAWNIYGDRIEGAWSMAVHYTWLRQEMARGTLRQNLEGLQAYKVARPLRGPSTIYAAVPGFQLAERGKAQEVFGITPAQEALAYGAMGGFLEQHATALEQQRRGVVPLPAKMRETIDGGGLALPTIYLIQGPARTLEGPATVRTSVRGLYFPTGCAAEAAFLYTALSGGMDCSAITLVNPREAGTEDWYEQCLEICVEMCAWVARKKNPEKYYLRWSS